jgi:hypothetical protein
MMREQVGVLLQGYLREVLLLGPITLKLQEISLCFIGIPRLKAPDPISEFGRIMGVPGPT